MTTTIFNIKGEKIRTSKNLRGLLDHARRTTPESIHFWKVYGGGYGVEVHFANGDYAQTEFADWRVMAQWFAERRSWGELFCTGWPKARAKYMAFYAK